MALSTSLDFSTSIGGARLQCWTVTGDGSAKRFNTQLLRPIACWVQNEDDSSVSGTSVTVSGTSIVLYKAITSAKKYKVFVLGE